MLAATATRAEDMLPCQELGAAATFCCRDMQASLCMQMSMRMCHYQGISDKLK